MNPMTKSQPSGTY